MTHPMTNPLEAAVKAGMETVTDGETVSRRARELIARAALDAYNAAKALKDV